MKMKIWLRACSIASVSTVACLAQGAGTSKTTPENDTQMMSRQEVTSIVADSRKIVSPNGIEELKEIPDE